MSDNENDNKAPEQTMDFFKYMDETIKREEAKRAIVFPTDAKPESKEPLTDNREYYRRYGHRATERMWIGPRRYR